MALGVVRGGNMQEYPPMKHFAVQGFVGGVGISSSSFMIQVVVLTLPLHREPREALIRTRLTASVAFRNM